MPVTKEHRRDGGHNVSLIGDACGEAKALLTARELRKLIVSDARRAVRIKVALLSLAPQVRRHNCRDCSSERVAGHNDADILLVGDSPLCIDNRFDPVFNLAEGQ